MDGEQDTFLGSAAGGVGWRSNDSAGFKRFALPGTAALGLAPATGKSPHPNYALPGAACNTYRQENDWNVPETG
jgi:hypothetical protein